MKESIDEDPAIRPIRRARLVRFALASVLVAAAVAAQPARAASIAATTIDEMLDKAEFVFEGEVTDVRVEEARQLGGAGRITVYTVCVFSVIDVIKSPPDGPVVGDTVSLSFLGGSAGGRTVIVHDLIVPSVGERGMYFIESLDRFQANPIYGWSQGHFLVDGVGANARVTTAHKAPVTTLESAPPSPTAQTSTGVARGVLTEDSKITGRSSRAMTPDEFKSRLREMLSSNQ